MKILLGVCGGVAAYKAADLVRELQRRGAEVQVVMTEGAQKFVTPLTFAALSGRQVLTSLWSPATPEVGTGGFEIEHIAEANAADVLVIAPATADFLAKMAHGAADDLLSTMVLAATAPVFVAPAMNVNMWNHAATQANVATLQARGVRVISPGAGELACGMVGTGRLAEPAEIAAVVMGSRDLERETVLVTAGGTREAIDPVRFIGNRSSGKMGHALAEAAVARGARVVLVTTAAMPAPGCEVVRVATAAEMQRAVLGRLSSVTVVVMAAAVSDYRVAAVAPQKLKKAGGLTLELVQNEDILRRVVAERSPGTLVIGFAAETERLMEEAGRKLRKKGLDGIVGNDVSRDGVGFEADRNGGVFLTAGSVVVLPESSKREMADRIWDQVAGLRVGLRGGTR